MAYEDFVLKKGASAPFLYRLINMLILYNIVITLKKTMIGEKSGTFVATRQGKCETQLS